MEGEGWARHTPVIHLCRHLKKRVPSVSAWNRLYTVLCVVWGGRRFNLCGARRGGCGYRIYIYARAQSSAGACGAGAGMNQRPAQVSSVSA